MRKIMIFIALMSVSAAFAFAPQPVKRSRAETDIIAMLATESADSVKIAAAKSVIETHGEDIPACRAAQDYLLKKIDDPLNYFKNVMEERPASIGAHYLYGRASKDSTMMSEQAAWVLAQNPNLSWGYELAGYAEWYKAKSDTTVLIRNFKAAIAADPSRPEGYLYLGWVYWDEERWPEMRDALDAGAVCDPTDTFIRNARLTVFAEQRDADSFFKLMTGVFPETPLSADLPRANGGAHVTTQDFIGAPTVIEYWAYT